MAGTLMLCCGSQACVIADRLVNSGLPALSIDWHDADIQILDPGEKEDDFNDSVAILPKIRDRSEQILERMRGFTDVIAIISAGGRMGTDSVKIIRDCAVMSSCRFTLVVTVPYVFEGDRRTRVFERLSGYSQMADCIFVLDLQCAFKQDMVIGDALDSGQLVLQDTVTILAYMMESAPFSSMFPRPSYTVARGDGPSLMDAFKYAMANPMFDSSMVDTPGQIVICTDGPVSDQDADHLISECAGIYGNVPELIRGKGQGNGMSVFIPIFLRSGSVSPHPR